MKTTVEPIKDRISLLKQTKLDLNVCIADISTSLFVRFTQDGFLQLIVNHWPKIKALLIEAEKPKV